MIMDDFLKLADGMTITTGATTSYVDLQARADGNVGDWVVFRIDATVPTSADTLEMGLCTWDGSTLVIGTSETLVSTTVAFSKLKADTIVARLRIPPGTMRYISGFLKVSENALAVTASTIDCHIVTDVDINELIEA